MAIRKYIFFLPIVLMILLLGCNKKQKDAGTPAPLVPPDSVSAPATVDPGGKSTLPEGIQYKLAGKWIRSDGSYTIEVFSVKEDGKMDAGYFNPNPIHVEKSEWKIAENSLYVRIILKDINYPGSTYTMMYDVDKDLLTGNYFQAVEGVNYDVAFQRMIEKK